MTDPPPLYADLVESLRDPLEGLEPTAADAACPDWAPLLVAAMVHADLLTADLVEAGAIPASDLVEHRDAARARAVLAALMDAGWRPPTAPGSVPYLDPPGLREPSAGGVGWPADEPDEDIC